MFEQRCIMEQLRIVRKVNNLEILCKLMDSVAKQCDCRVKYSPDQGVMRFYGDTDCKEFIAKQTLSFFRAA